MEKYNYNDIKNIMENEFINYLKFYSNTSMFYDQGKKIPEEFRKYINPQHATQTLIDSIKIKIEDYVNDSSKYVYVAIIDGNIFLFLDYLLLEYETRLHQLLYLIPIYHDMKVYDNPKNLLSSMKLGIFIQVNPVTKQVYHNSAEANIKKEVTNDFWNLVDKYYNDKITI